MADDPKDFSGENIRQAASESVQEGVDIRARVRDLTLSALGRRRFDRHGLREVVRAVTEGISLGAESGRADMRRALADAFRGLDDAMVKSVQAGQEALKRLIATGKDFSDHELKQALANLKKVEDDFVGTVSQVAEGASEKVRPELRAAVSEATRAGTQTGRQIASTMTEFGRRFSGAALEVTLAGLEAAGEFGARFALAASGVLAAMADALQQTEAARKDASGAEQKEPPQAR